MRLANIITFILLAIGGLNWLLIGIFNVNVVDLVFGTGSALSIIIYILVGLSALWLIFSAIYNRGIKMNSDESL